MRVFVVPASGKTAIAAIRSLLDQTSSQDYPPIEIKAVYRNTAKALPEFISKSNIEVLKGDITDASSLDFTGADAVITLTPSVYDGRDIVKYAETVSENVKAAIERAGTVKRLVLVSSMGAHLSEGVGEIKTCWAAERTFSTANVPRITFVRCSYFMENWTMDVSTLKGSEPFFFSTVTPLDYKMPMVAVRDIGRTLATQVLTKQENSKSPQIFELHGPVDYTPLDVQAAFSKALGRDVAVKPIEKDQLEGFFGQVFPPAVVREWVEMTTSFLPGGPALDNLPPEEERGSVRGTVNLDEAIGEAVRVVQ